jgi:5-methylcytosine-specific restriction endonuclease McrA
MLTRKGHSHEGAIETSDTLGGCPVDDHAQGPEASGREEIMRTTPRLIFPPSIVPEPQHWRGMLHSLPHSHALLIRDATGARFPLTPDDCRRKCKRTAKEVNTMKEKLWRKNQRYGFVRCHWCGTAMTRKETTRDHVIAKCFGGRDILDNVVPACQPCNYRRSVEQARLMEELRLEWTIAELRMVA